MQLLALLLVVICAAAIVLAGFLPAEQLQDWIAPIGTVFLLAAGVGLSLRIWLAARSLWQTGVHIKGRVAEGMREPVRYGVPLPHDEQRLDEAAGQRPETASRKRGR